MTARRVLAPRNPRVVVADGPVRDVSKAFGTPEGVALRYWGNPTRRNAVPIPAVYADGKYNGRTLAEWMPEAVDDIVAKFDPVRVILFGSVARGEEGPDSDLDFLVVLDHLDKSERMELMGKIRFAIDAPCPIDVFVTDEEEFEARKDVNGSMYYWPSREGRVVYERPHA